MKSKRQTIWLVSMLSLMVILSAYYLFTEDADLVTPKTTEGQQATNLEEIAGGGIMKGSALSEDDIIVTEIQSGNEGDTGVDGATLEGEEDSANIGAEGETGESAQPQADDNATSEANESAGSNDGKSSGESRKQENNSGNSEESSQQQNDTTTDADVLKKLEAEGGITGDSLTAYQMERAEQNIKKQEQLLETISDENKSLEEAAMAHKQLSALEEKEAKITDIEERLQQQYADAVVKEENDSYKVVVISEKLQVKEAVNIVDLVIKELGVSQDKVKVQYVSE